VIKPAYSVSFLLSINIFVWQNVLYFPNDLRIYAKWLDQAEKEDKYLYIRITGGTWKNIGQVKSSTKYREQWMNRGRQRQKTIPRINSHLKILRHIQAFQYY
jgi:hypothetical protein